MVPWYVSSQVSYVPLYAAMGSFLNRRAAGGIWLFYVVAIGLITHGCFSWQTGIPIRTPYRLPRPQNSQRCMTRSTAAARSRAVTNMLFSGETAPPCVRDMYVLRDWSYNPSKRLVSISCTLNGHMVQEVPRPRLQSRPHLQTGR